MSIEAMKQALEALEPVSTYGRVGSKDTDTAKAQQAITALRQAIEQAQQAEPVAWFRYESVYEYRNQLARCTPKCIGAFPVYTAPPPRQPLTDEQLPEMWSEAVRKAALPPNKSALIHYKEAIEAAHGIKGEA